MRKKYLIIEADIQKDGTTIPRILIDEEGQSHAIRAKRIVPLDTTKKGGSDLQYDVEIDGIPQQIYLEFADSYTQKRRWYRIH